MGLIWHRPHNWTTGTDEFDTPDLDAVLGRWSIYPRVAPADHFLLHL